MNHGQFAVYTFGACGSLWLAGELSRMTGYTVEHEPEALSSGASADEVERYIADRGYWYGLVDPRCRGAIAQLDGRVGVLRRNPLAQALSAFNRHPEWAASDDRFSRSLALMVEACETSAALEANGRPVLRIDAHDLGASLVRWICAMGIEYSGAVLPDVAPRHSHGRSSFEMLADLGPERERMVLDALAPFAAMWGYL